MDDEKAAMFLSITGLNDVNTAKQFLEMANGNVDHAVSIYFEGGIGGSAPPPPADAENVRAPMNAFDDQIIENRSSDGKYFKL